jgi:uncharacterized membrane protein (DUF485 family)
MTLAFLGWYFLFVVLAAFAPGFLRRPAVGHLSVGLCLGVLQFVTTFVTTVLYSRWAARVLDPATDRLRRHLDREPPR